MYMIEIEEGKVDKMAELAEKMLKYGGKLMSCIEELSEESGMGERGGGSYGKVVKAVAVQWVVAMVREKAVMVTEEVTESVKRIGKRWVRWENAEE